MKQEQQIVADFEVTSHTSKNYCKNEDQSGITQNQR